MFQIVPALLLLPSLTSAPDSVEVSSPDNIQLNEVTVTASQRTESRGHTLIYPSQADVKASTTAVSLFQKLALPGLQANPVNRTLSVDGGTPVILINGLSSTMDDVNALSPHDISRIEYSRSTPPRYASGSNTGFINITLKKRPDGGQVYTWGRTALNAGFGDGNLRGSYHQGKSQWTLSYSPSWRDYRKVYDTTTESYIAPDYEVNLTSQDRNPFSYLQNPLKLKYDFTPSEHTVLSATLGSQLFSDHRRVIGHTIDSRLGEYDNLNKTRSSLFAPSLDLYLRHNFQGGNALEVQVVGTLSNGDYHYNNLYTLADGNTMDFETDVDSHRRSLISEVNYSHTFSRSTSLTVGYQNTLSHSRNSYRGNSQRPLLTENHNYAYAALGQQLGRVYLNLSTGLKAFWTRNDINRRHFVRNISSATLNWSPAKNLSFQGLVRYTPSIPGLSSLTDYPQQLTPYLVTNGNPQLRVAENLSSVISASYERGLFTFDYQFGTLRSWRNMITDVVYLGDGHFLSHTINSRHSTVMQHYVGATLKNFHGFGANISGTLSHYNSVTDHWNYSLTSFSANMSMWYTLDKFTVSYWHTFPGKAVDGYYVTRNENGSDLTVDYAHNKHLTISASWMYMFDRNGTQYPQWSHSPVNPSATTRCIRDNANMVVLSLTYNADFGTLFRTPRRTLNNADTTSTILK